MTIVSQVFAPLGRREAEFFDFPALPMVIVPHPFASKPDAEIRRIAAEIAPQVAAALTGEGGDR